MSKVVLAVVGPTAVGKSAVADIVASRLSSEVVSADAMQVYRGMDIGTAKTPVAERPVPLRMVDVADPGVAYSAALFQRDARAVIDGLLADGKTPVVCGGTGLYVRAALDEMDFPAGEVGGSSRERYERIAASEGEDALYRLLAERDPESAACIHPHNVRRVVRALEMLDEGTSYARQRAGFSTPREHYPTRYFGLTMDRARLYERIDRRVDAMMDAGLLDEVRGLMEQGAAPALTARQAIGYKELIDVLEGRMALDDAVELIKRRSRRYAKRQLTWFRRDRRIAWLDLDDLTVEDAAMRILDSMGE